jgi:hypothetical protein
MLFIQLYLFFGLVMTLVVLWDFKTVPKTASRYTKKALKKETGFALIILSIRNLVIMATMAFFLWPVIIGCEIFGKEDQL